MSRERKTLAGSEKLAILRRYLVEKAPKAKGKLDTALVRKVDAQSFVIEHVNSRPEGNNGYRNVVAACRQCNNRKGPGSAEDLLRTLYRDGFLTDAEFEGRLSHLQQLEAGLLRPVLSV